MPTPGTLPLPPAVNTTVMTTSVGYSGGNPNPNFVLSNPDNIFVMDCTGELIMKPIMK